MSYQSNIRKDAISTHILSPMHNTEAINEEAEHECYFDAFESREQYCNLLKANSQMKVANLHNNIFNYIQQQQDNQNNIIYGLLILLICTQLQTDLQNKYHLALVTGIYDDLEMLCDKINANISSNINLPILVSSFASELYRFTMIDTDNSVLPFTHIKDRVQKFFASYNLCLSVDWNQFYTILTLQIAPSTPCDLSTNNSIDAAQSDIALKQSISQLSDLLNINQAMTRVHTSNLETINKHLRNLKLDLASIMSDPNQASTIVSGLWMGIGLDGQKQKQFHQLASSLTSIQSQISAMQIALQMHKQNEASDGIGISVYDIENLAENVASIKAIATSLSYNAKLAEHCEARISRTLKAQMIITALMTMSGFLIPLLRFLPVIGPGLLTGFGWFAEYFSDTLNTLGLAY